MNFSLRLALAVLSAGSHLRSVAAFSPSSGTTTQKSSHHQTRSWNQPLRVQSSSRNDPTGTTDEDDDHFPDPHALMEYLDGNSGGAFVSFEDYLELQRKQKYLRECPLFRGCSDDDLSRIAGKMVLQKVAPQQAVVVQGDAGGDAMYFLKSGSFRAVGEEETSNGTSTQTTIYTTYSKEGSYFGELALLFGQARAASVVSVGAAEVYRLEKTAFLDSLVDSPVYETARRLVLAKYKSARIRDVLPKIRPDEVVGLLKARLFRSHKNKHILERWMETSRAFCLGACASLVVTKYVQASVMKPLVLLALGLLAHLL